MYIYIDSNGDYSLLDQSCSPWKEGHARTNDAFIAAVCVGTSLSITMSIIYASAYFLIFVVASIYSYREIRDKRKKDAETTDDPDISKQRSTGI